MSHLITGSHHVVAPATPIFYVQYDNRYILRVTSMDVGGGTLMDDGSTGIPSYNMGIILAPDATTTVAVDNDGSDDWMTRSTSSGGTGTWTQKLNMGRWSAQVTFAENAHKDKKDGNIIWATNRTASNWIAYYSKDGGDTWTTVTLGAWGAGWTAYCEYAVPDDNGRYGYIICTKRNSPYTGTHGAYIFRVDSTDGSYSSWTLPAGAYLDLDEAGFFRGTTQYGYPNVGYITTRGWESLWKFDWNAQTITLLNDGDTSSGTHIDDYQLSTKQITTTTNGTLLMAMSPYSSGNYLYVYRSTDAGASWVKHDLSAYILEDVNGTWDYVKESSGTLFMALRSNYNAGTYETGGAYSTDDGVTWQQTGVLYSSSTYTLDYPYGADGVL